MATEKKTEAAAEKLPDPYELEEIFIPRAGAKEDPNLFVSVNGVNYKIRRGVEVEVPPEVAEVLEHSQMQDERTAARIAAAENAAQ